MQVAKQDVRQDMLHCSAVALTKLMTWRHKPQGLTESTCMPQPAQEAFPQAEQVTLRHMVAMVLKGRVKQQQGNGHEQTGSHTIGSAVTGSSTVEQTLQRGRRRAQQISSLPENPPQHPAEKPCCCHVMCFVSDQALS